MLFLLAPSAPEMMIFKRERRCSDYRRISSTLQAARTKIEDIAADSEEGLGVWHHSFGADDVCAVAERRNG
jgi:hypothetical protein